MSSYSIKSCAFIFFIALFLFPLPSFATEKGIYITQSTLENTSRINYLIGRAKAVGINTFVVDYNKVTKAYERNIALVKASGIKYVARIVMFADGGTDEQVLSRDHWEKKYQKALEAVRLGAHSIQLDYIRYSSKQAPSPQNAHNVVKVIQWFKTKLSALNIPLQADVFGITAFHEEKRIGQNVKLIGPEVDAMCPMVYPSHFEPYREHAVKPYETIYSSMVSLDKQFNGQRTFKLYPYIELSNYRYPLSTEQRHHYIKAQLKAVKDSNADGWYAWSANNSYDNLFHVMENDRSV